jgi:hypothetical protein
MRLYGAIQKVEPQDDGTVRVHGIATSEAVDEQGEIVRAEAMRAAIPDYMRFPALREMHQLSAAGTTLEAEVCEDGTTRIVAHVVDPIAVAKVKNQVYRGFSIGGQITQRDPGNPKAITSLVLNEISLVDRPANPEAIFDCWKAVLESEYPATRAQLTSAGRGLIASARDALPREPFNSPIQLWACGVPHHRHLAKADASKCIEKQAVEPIRTQTSIDASAERGESTHEDQYVSLGYHPDGRRRYPLDTGRQIPAAWGYISGPSNGEKYANDQQKQIRAAITAARREEIDSDGPTSGDAGEKSSRAALTKALREIGQIARASENLDWLKDNLDPYTTIEDNNSPQAARMQAMITELCGFLNELLAKEAGEFLGDAAIDDILLAPQTHEILATAAGASGMARIAALLQKGSPNMRKFAASLLAKAEHAPRDQMLVDIAYLACNECLKLDGLSADQEEQVIKARAQLTESGAVTVDGMDQDVAASPNLEMLDIITALFGKRQQPHRITMDIAHECIKKLSDGSSCGEAEKIGSRHSEETTRRLETAHRHLVAAGAKCDAAHPGGSRAVIEDDREDSELEPDAEAQAGDLALVLAGQRAEKTALAKMLAEIVPTLERLTKRVDDIARNPLPPLTIAKGTVSVSKQQDRGGASNPALSPETISSAFAKLSKEEQTLTLIKASYANPIRLHGSAASEP